MAAYKGRDGMLADRELVLLTFLDAPGRLFMVVDQVRDSCAHSTHVRSAELGCVLVNLCVQEHMVQAVCGAPVSHSAPSLCAYDGTATYAQHSTGAKLLSLHGLVNA